MPVNFFSPMIETQRMVASKLETVESRAANAQQKLETTQNELMEARTKFEEDRIAKNEEIELIMNDLGKSFHALLIISHGFLFVTEKNRNRGSIKSFKCEKVLSF